MKRALLIGSVVVALGLVVVGFTAPALADDPNDGEATPRGSEVWDEMHEACINGDWEAMIEAAERIHGEDFASMPCHGGYNGEGNNVRTGGWGTRGGGMMGGGMMGGTWR